MTVSRFLILFTGLMLGTVSVSAQTAQPSVGQPVEKPKVVKGAYDHGQISHIIVDAQSGTVFFDAGEDPCVWQLRTGNDAEKLQAAFIMADRLSQAAKIETRRWIYPEARPGFITERYRDGRRYYSVEVLLHQGGAAK